MKLLKYPDEFLSKQVKEVDLENPGFDPVALKKEMVDLKKAQVDDELHVTYSYDKSQNMHCTFEHIESGNKFELEIKSLSSDTVDKAAEQMKNFDIE